jgi:hypothetical protein
MKTLKFSYLGDVVGIKVADGATMAKALNQAFQKLDLEYSEQWDILDEGGNVVETTTKVKLFREGTKFVLKAPLPSNEDIAKCAATLADLPPFKTPRQVSEPAKAAIARSAAETAGGVREVGVMVSAAPQPLPMPLPVLPSALPSPPPASIAPLQAMPQTMPAPAAPVAVVPTPPPPAKSAAVIEEMPVEVATVSLHPITLIPGQPWPVHGQMRIGQLTGEMKKVG